MRRLTSWLVGFGIGGAVSALLVVLFVEDSAELIRARLRYGYEQTMAESRRASQQRRQELEAKLNALRARRPQSPA